MRDRILILAFLALVTLPVPLDRIFSSLGIAMPGRSLARESGRIEIPADCYDGSAGSKAEDRLRNRSYFARSLTANYNELSFLLLHRTPQAGRLGRDGWIFVTSRVVDYRASHWAALKEAAVQDIGRVDAFLRERGARLVVGLIPDRVRVNPDRAYPSGRLPDGKGAFLPDLEEALRRDGVDVIPLTGALRALRESGREPFFSDDHHWTSSGAERGALELAEAARPLLGVYRENLSPAFALRWDLDVPSPGSLIAKLGFRPGSRLEAGFRDREPRLSFEPRAIDTAPPWSGSCASYWTTSFGSWGSPQVFANAIGCPVRIRLMRGEGSEPVPASEIRQIGLERPDLQGHVVVWEIPEYHLVVPPGRLPGFVRISEALGEFGG